MKKWLFILTIFTALQCRDPYNVIMGTNGDGVLVVEGILNGNGISQIKLSRTTRLSDIRIEPETGAVLIIEGESDGSTHLLSESTAGIYRSENIVFGDNSRYRLKIQTKDSREYATDYKPFLLTPELDSVTWSQSPGGVQLYSHAHNDNAASPYYKWDYEETWEYKSAFRAMLGFKEVPPDSAGNRYVLDWLMPDQTVDNSLFTCYNSRSSTSINIISTESLGSNVLLFPLRFIGTGSIEMSFLYSIIVRQYALSKDGYDFFARMKKNTESLGSIFDAQPSEISGNVKCSTDPAEIVIGYVEASTVAEKRIFIDNQQLPGWGYDARCKHFFETNSEFSEYPYPNDPSLFNHIASRSLMPTVPVETFGNFVLRFNVEFFGCVDCRFLGGKPGKPAFWP